jgi:dipeptidyl-peptidase III
MSAQHNGGFQTPYADLAAAKNSPADLKHELDDLRVSLFDATFEPMTTAKSPVGGKDTIQASSNTFYPGLSLADLKGFQEKYPLNSRVVKGADGKLTELVYRAGTPDGKVPPGVYATFLKKPNDCFQKARAYAEPAKPKAIDHLIRYYQTGDYAEWVAFGTAWVQNDATVDFDNGFIEVYRDARGAKGSSQSFVTITDKPVTTTMKKLAQNAGYFEEKAPWDAKYKLTSFKLPVVKAVETLIETGDFSVTTIGDNLPNENEIHEKYGSKNFLFTSSDRALDEATGKTANAEFAASPAEVERSEKYGMKRQPHGRPARSHRPRLRQAERPRQRRRAAFPQGIFFHARRSTRRPDGPLERLGSQAERTRPDLEPGRSGRRPCMTAPPRSP